MGTWEPEHGAERTPGAGSGDGVVVVAAVPTASPVVPPPAPPRPPFVCSSGGAGGRRGGEGAALPHPRTPMAAVGAASPRTAPLRPGGPIKPRSTARLRRVSYIDCLSVVL